MRGHQRQHRGTYVYPAVCMCAQVSFCLKMSIYIYEDAHKCVLSCVAQSNQYLSMRTDTIIIWYLFKFLFIQAEVPENLRHLLAKLLALMGFTSYSQVNQKQMQAGSSQDKLPLCHCFSIRSSTPGRNSSINSEKLQGSLLSGLLPFLC